MDENINPSCNINVMQETTPIGKTVPLAVDLDGSLLRTDSLIELLLQLLKANPLFVPLLFVWLLKGKAHLKRQVCNRVSLDVSTLPYNIDVLEYLRGQEQLNRSLILVTGADKYIAQQIADYLLIFNRVIASDGQNNITGISKKDRLLAEFGHKGFDYLGNDKKDIVVWQVARKSIIVGSKRFVENVSADLTNIDRIFENKNEGISRWIQALRIYQWLKNFLIFIPLLAAHRYLELNLVFSSLVALLSFGFCASSVYVLNDLLDLTEDRRHPRKRFRPFASGVLPLADGIIICVLLLLLSFVVGLSLPDSFLFILLIYYLTTLAYSMRLKSFVVLDVIVLAGLFTLRMMAGSAAVDIWPSSWLLAHSMFLFISLALVKRYSELVTMQNEYGLAARARSYVATDSALLAVMGIASAFVSALVFVLYIASGTARLSYGRHHLIWLVCPLLLYWLCYIWLVAHRGKMHDDPMLFALKDRTSRFTLIAMAILMFVAH